MARMKFFLRLLPLTLALIPALPALGQGIDSLPSAPGPNAPAPEHASDTAHIAPNKWFGVVDPGEKVPPLHPGDKMKFWLHEEVSPLSLLPAFVSAGYGQVTGFDPKYGSDSGAFGERLGAAALREASMRFLSDSFLPTLTHSDPRYYRLGSGSLGSRSKYALERLVIEQRDSGAHGLNYSDIFGRLGGSALAMTYYPAASVNARVVFRTWGTSLGGAEVNNLFLEFWPDIRDAVFHHNRKSARLRELSADSGSE